MENNEPPGSPSPVLQGAASLVAVVAAVSSFWFTEWGSTFQWAIAIIIGTFVLVVGIAAIAARRREDRTQFESQARVREAERGLEDALRIVVVDSVNHGTIQTGSEDDSPEPAAWPERRAQEDTQARLTLPELWAVTHRRLDHYHGIALGQARRSFLNAQIAMGLGFTLLIAFVVVAFNASTTAGTVVAGGLGAVSAALSGYVSRTFIRSQEAAAGHLRAYFDQPLEFSRYLAAERLMADVGLSEDKRAEVLSLLVQAMITGPASPTSKSPASEQPGNAP